jgi:hypothetical protein
VTDTPKTKYRLMKEPHVLSAGDNFRYYIEKLQGNSWLYVSGSMTLDEKRARAFFEYLIAGGQTEPSVVQEGEG